MSKLKQALKHHGINTAGLDLLFGSGREAVHGLVTEGSSAVELWRRLRTAAGEIGYWPILLGNDADLERHGQSLMMSEEAGHGSAQDLIAAGSKLDVITWLTARASEDGGRSAPPPGEWPAGGADHANHHFTVPTDHTTGKPLARVNVGLIPTVIGWQVPAFLRFGGWNHCPAPQHHVAMLKHWRHAYGAEPVAFSADVMELAVARPPQDRAAAMRLAREQFVYCPDIVHQGTGSIERLAAALLRGTAWFFWWD